MEPTWGYCVDCPIECRLRPRRSQSQDLRIGQPYASPDLFAVDRFTEGEIFGQELLPSYAGVTHRQSRCRSGETQFTRPASPPFKSNSVFRGLGRELSAFVEGPTGIAHRRQRNVPGQQAFTFPSTSRPSRIRMSGLSGYRPPIVSISWRASQPRRISSAVATR